MNNTLVEGMVILLRTVLAFDLGNTSDVASTESKGRPSKDEQKSQPQEAGVKLGGDHVREPPVRVTMIWCCWRRGGREVEMGSMLGDILNE